ncbi:uncharacterized protein FIBRA_08274 [Fibroporia radiculosa]|uniref:M-phase inducer phosphatase n=1 Tax=Fibroporia radiculosa TaxID=599839 RepID=J4H531_9APHY|nr:uncharacterized protein FIBRA_08274 [Fibroporia radiculosa]CCM06029.1 predicted protein [Fibroporia radiculosa]
MRTQTTILKKARRAEQPRPYPQEKKRIGSKHNVENMSYFPTVFGLATNKPTLAVPPAPSRKLSQRMATVRNELDDFLSSDLDADLELSFASTMSLNSPPRNPADLTPENENPNHVPMDISPAPPRIVVSTSQVSAFAKPLTGRPRAFTSGARLFGRDVSNDTSSVASFQSSAKSTGTGGAAKRLQRSALPLEWMGHGQQDTGFSQPRNVPPSPATSDAMDIDSSFVHVPSTSAPDSDGPLSAAPTITAFNIGNDALLSSPVPASAAPTVTQFTNLFYDVPAHDISSDMPEGFEHMPHESEISQSIDSPYQPFPKKRRSSPAPHPVRRAVLEQEASLDSSPAPLSPVVLKMERIANSQMLKKPMLSGLGAPLELNANKKRPRRPALSAMVAPGEGPISQPRSAYPSTSAAAQGDKENRGLQVPVNVQHVMPPVRRAFSAMLPPSLMEQSMSSEEGASFGNESAEMSSPAQAYARRQQVKTIRRCDGTDDFRPITGATALVRRDTEVMMRSLRRSESREDRVSENIERDTPRSKYLSASSGLKGFGDNEAHGKILPCHRVREDGLMRITTNTLDDLLDGRYNSHIESFHVIDCRFDYEYYGGHVPGAININTTTGVEDFLLGSDVYKPTPSISGDSSRKTILVFHCEFSAKRAPTFAKHLRSKDRSVNNHVYPRIHYPEVYILEGGYNQYYQDSADRCEPRGYVQMDDPHYAASRKEDLDQFRKGKFGRTKSYAYGDGKLVSALSQQSKRNTAPSSGGTSALFAAANAARTRRGGLGNTGLQALAEDGSASHHSEDEDTDIGDSPCPPPSKTTTYRGMKIGRLSRAETYDATRLATGY